VPMELPNADGGGGPAGVKDPAEEGGGPAGVVEGFAPYEKMLLDLLSGVEGGLEEKGTWNAIALSSALRCGWFSYRKEFNKVATEFRQAIVSFVISFNCRWRSWSR